MKTCVICVNSLSGQQQKYCSNKCKQKDHYHRVKEQTNTYHLQTTRAIKRKLVLIEMMGGGCMKCGYSDNISALHFHHIDSQSKVFKLGARMLSNRSWDAIIKETKKCELLCANCHAETHNPELHFNKLSQYLDKP